MTSRSTRGLWDVGRSWLANALAVGRIAGHLLTGPVLVRRRREWGATTYETVEDLPGDEVLSPSWQATRAVTVAVPPEQVWPWLVQLGQSRGGFYSYELLENLIGCRIRNAARIELQWQSLARGDEVRLHPNMPGLVVSVVDAPRDLVLVGRPRGGSVGIVWSFHLRSHPDGCRLVERTRMVYGADCLGRLGGSEWLLGSIAHVMSTGMLRNIKALAERGEIAPVSGVDAVALPELTPTVDAPPAAADIPAAATEESILPADAPVQVDATKAVPDPGETVLSEVILDSRRPDSVVTDVAEPAITPPYQRHTKAALYDEARRRNIRGRSAMSKAALVAALEADDRR